MSRGPLGRVADMGDGMSFSAHVEYAESEGPFSFMNGPEFVEAGAAVGWARRHAPRVVVRVGSDFFSAGEEGYGELPPWPGPVAASGNDGVGPVRPWSVEARMAWFRGDAVEVAERLAEEVGSAAESSGAGFGRTQTGFRVTFVVSGVSAVEANETASRVLRAAWAATGIETTGDDFDATSVTVREDAPGAAAGIDRPV
jgi:hypothetical protein